MAITWHNDGTGYGTDEHGRLMHDCVYREPVKGAKAGQEKPRKPSIAKDSVASTSTAKILYGLAEGQTLGLVDGGKSIFLDETPLLDDAGSPNFENVTWDFRAGTNDQEYIKGFPDVSNEMPVNVELKSTQPWIKAFTDTQLSAVRVRFKWNRLSKTDPENGDVKGYRIDYAIDLQTDGGVYKNVLTTKIEDKTSAGYERTHRIDLPRATTGWQIRVRRITPNDSSEFVQDTMLIDAVAEVIDVKLRYPNTALLGLQYNGETFGSIAKLEAHMRGSIIRVPSNYDPVTRSYTGIWDGTFKDAYTNNPAWVYFDLCTQWRYGLGERLDITMIDKWSLYALGQYCDQPVSDGKGGLEPRFTCNVYLQKQADAYQVLQNIAGIFRAMSFWDGERIVLDADVPQDPVYTFSRANVVDGNFEYTGTRARDRHTLAKVAYDNPSNRFETEYDYIRDEKAMAKFGVKVLDLSAFGCTSQAQAQRAGLWALKTEQLESRQVSFVVGLDGFIPKVGNIINVSDEVFAGRATGGRISAVSEAQYVVTVDRDVIAAAGDTLIVNGSSGKSERRTIKSVAGRKITLNAAFATAEAQNVWAIETEDLKLMRFRVMSISKEDDATFAITAIQHEPQKFSAIDFGTDVKPTDITIVNPDTISAPDAVTITSRHRVVQGQTVATLVIGWSQVKNAVAYDVEWRKDDGTWVKVPRTGNVSVDVEGVYSGNYLARIRSVSAFDVQSQPTTSMLTEIKGKVGLPPTVVGLSATGVLFGMEIKWGFSVGSKDADYTELQVGSAPNVNVATLTQVSYPTNAHTITGLQGNLSQSYRARIVDKLGFKSAWSSWVTGTTEADAGKIIDMIQGQIDESVLDESLRSEIEKIDVNKSILDDLGVDLNGKIAQAKTSISQAQADIASSKTIIDANKIDLTKAKADIVSANTLIKANKDKLVLTDTEVAAAKIKINTLESDYNGNKASVSNALTVLTNADKAFVQDITTLKSNVAGNTADITTNNTAMVTKTTALTNSINAINAEYTTNKANVTRDLTALANKDTAIVSDIDALKVKTDDTNAEISTVKTAVADNKSSIANVKTELKADYNNLTIGGTNLLLDSTFNRYSKLGDATVITGGVVAAGSYIKVTAKGDVGFGLATHGGMRKTRITQGRTYTLSFWGQATFNSLNYVYLMRADGDNFHVGDIAIGNGLYGKRSITFVAPWSTDEGYILMAAKNYSADNWFAFGGLMLEEGNKATSWSPAPQDVDAAISLSNAAITTEATARADADSAITSSVNTLKSEYDTNKATVTNSLATLTNKDVALTNSISALDSDYKGNKATVTNSLTALTNKDIALTNSINSLTSTVGGNTTAITNEATTRASADSALSTRINTNLSKADNALSRITTAETTIASNTQAISQVRTDLTADFDEMQIGGYNLLPNTILSYDNIEQYSDATLWIFKDRLADAVRATNNIAGRGVFGFVFKGDSSKKIKIKANTEYTLSFYGSASVSSLNYIYIMRDSGNNRGLPSIPIDSNFNKKRSVTFTLDEDITDGYLMVSTYGDKGDQFWVGSLTLQQGNKATEWTQSPLDFENSLAVSNARITTESTTRAAGDLALTNALTTLDSDYKGNKSSVSNSLSTLSAKDVALTNSLNSLSSTVGGHTSSISTLNQTTASNTNAIAQARTDLTAKVDDLEIGGQNLLPNSDFSKGYTVWNTSSLVTQAEILGLGFYTTVTNTTEGGTFGVYATGAYRKGKIYKGQTYTLSWLGQGTFDGLNYLHLLSSKSGNVRLPSVPLKGGRANKYEVTFTAPYTTDDLNILMGALDKPKDAWFQFSGLMLQKGGKATEWTPSPLDAEEGIKEAKASIVSEAKVAADANKATADELKTVSAKASGNSANIQTLTNTTSSLNTAIASTKTTLEAKIDNQVVGGDNLIIDSTFKKGAVPYGSATTYIGQSSGFETPYVRVSCTALNSGFGVVPHSDARKVRVIGGEEYTLSFFGQGTFDSLGYIYLMSSSQPNQKLSSVPLGSGMRNKKSVTFIADRDLDDGFILIGGANQAVGAWFAIGGLQLQRGNKATTWQPSANEIASSLEETKEVVAGVSAQYTIKLDVGGRVSGFGLMSSANQSDFAINADKFWIAPPTGTSKGKSPFMVLTTSQTINGVSVPAGTYIESAFIHNGSIDSVKIRDAAITTAKIGNAQVDTLQLKGEAVTVPRLTYIPNPTVILRDNTVYNGTKYALVTVSNPPANSSTSFHSWTFEAARASFDPMGGSVSIQFSADMVYMSLELLQTPLAAPQFIELQVRRLGVNSPLRVKRTAVAEIIDGRLKIPAQTMTLPTVLDSPPMSLGSVTYVAEIVFYASSDTSGGRKDFRTATTHEIGFETASCQILGVKR